MAVSVVETAQNESRNDRPMAEPAVSRPEPLAQPAAVPTTDKPAPLVSATSVNTRLDKSMLDQAVDTLVSPQLTHSQKRATWKQLQESGKLDQAITELERRAASDPRSPDAAAALGQAYLKKCGTIQDIREQAILAMSADKEFDTALSLDPSNWEARFTKAVALSYWPANLNKGDEVIQHFQTLIQQQEAQAPQPEFAETYVWLGDQYNKAGHADYAREIWQRGAGLFPNNETLMKHLAAGQ
jgi:tetratricopeptide (TPR) repeat protein